MTRVAPVGIGAALLLVAASTMLGEAVFGRTQLAEIAMVYLLAIVVVALRWGRLESLFTAIASVLAFDYFFVPPYHTFAVDPRHLTTFAVMILVAAIMGGLVQRLREQRDAQIAAAVERTRLAEIAHAAGLEASREQLRSSLLSSVSHDLRTPLAVITGTATTLLDETLPRETRRELAETIVEEADRLARLVRNLLDMTRFEAGAIDVKKEWAPLEEIVGSALDRMNASLGGRSVDVRLPDDLPLVPLDAVLVEQVLVNLLENAVKYTPAGSPIAIEAQAIDSGKSVEVSVSDRGPGVPPGDEERIFEKFHRAEKGKGGGVGLGLTICRAIVTAHGGRIRAENREGGGMAFRFTLPIEGEPPAIAVEGSVPA